MDERNDPYLSALGALLLAVQGVIRISENPAQFHGYPMIDRQKIRAIRDDVRLLVAQGTEGVEW